MYSTQSELHFDLVQLRCGKQTDICIQVYQTLFFHEVYDGIDILVMSLQSVPYCLPTPMFVLVHYWMKNSMASVSEHMI